MIISSWGKRLYNLAVHYINNDLAVFTIYANRQASVPLDPGSRTLSVQGILGITNHRNTLQAPFSPFSFAGEVMSLRVWASLDCLLSNHLSTLALLVQDLYASFLHTINIIFILQINNSFNILKIFLLSFSHLLTSTTHCLLFRHFDSF